MPLDLNKARKCLAEFDFAKLFMEELGWDRHAQRLDLTVDGHGFTLTAIAHKRGMVAFLHEGKLPDYPTRRKIERQVAKNAHEHLLIFTDPQHTMQIWQWVKREPAKPLACREHTYHSGQPGDSLIQKLQALAFTIEDEEVLTLVDVTGRVRTGFDVERVTKRFYDRFKDEHADFLGFIKGIPDDELHRWYASVMLNRLTHKIYRQQQTLRNLMGRSQQACWFHDGPTYWIRALPFEPAGNASARSNHYHRLNGADQHTGLVLTSLIASSIFYFHFKLTSNCRDFGTREIDSFRFPALTEFALDELTALARRLGESLRQTAKRCSREYPSGTIEYDEYYPAKAKPIIDEIDRVLAKHYGFTDPASQGYAVASEELDFIINYDIKYRMGRDAGEDGEE